MSLRFLKTPYRGRQRQILKEIYVGRHFSERPMHLPVDSPWHSSAKHHISKASFA